MKFLDRTLRGHRARHVGPVQRRSNAGRIRLLTRRAQGIRIAGLHAQPDISQPIQVVLIEISASRPGPLTCVPIQAVEHLIGEDQRLPLRWWLGKVGRGAWSVGHRCVPAASTLVFGRAGGA
jgi:hypothetical protein